MRGEKKNLMNFVPRASYCELRSEMKVKRNKRLYLICFKTPHHRRAVLQTRRVRG